ncbi:MAG: hypothetical protein ACRD0G_00635 [Acidimicrobiales bacterium]
MERLRYVARAGGGDPAAIVAETVDALAGLRPEPSELVPLCRNLLDGHPSCGPLWWLCARLLADVAVLGDPWSLVDEIADDPTAQRLADGLPDDATTLVVGYPRLATEALCSRPDVNVLAVDAGEIARRVVRSLDRAGVAVDVVLPEAMLAAARAADIVIVEADACSTEAVVAAMGSGVAAVVAAAAGTPVWLVAGRGRRLPGVYVDTIVSRITGTTDPEWQSEFEVLPATLITHVAGPRGVSAIAGDTLVSECPAPPELCAPGPAGRRMTKEIADG